MWLSRVWSRGYVRMRRIFSTLRTITGWDHPFSAYTAPIGSKDASTTPIEKDDLLFQQPHRDAPSTITAKHLTFRLRTLRPKDG